MKENKIPRDISALHGMGVAAAKASSKTSTKTVPSGNSVTQPSTTGATAMGTPATKGPTAMVTDSNAVPLTDEQKV